MEFIEARIARPPAKQAENKFICNENPLRIRKNNTDTTAEIKENKREVNSPVFVFV